MMTQKITMISDLHLRKSTLDTYVTPKNSKMGIFGGNTPRLPENVSIYTNAHGDAILSYICPACMNPSDYANLQHVPSDLANLMKWMQSEDITFVEFHNTRTGELTPDEISEVFETESFLPFYDIPEEYVDTYQAYIQNMIAKAQK